MKKIVLLVFLVLLPLSGLAQSLWMNDLAEDRELPLTFGVGGNFFTMDQNYAIEQLTFDLPGVVIADPGLLDVRNKVWHLDAKLDAWVFPFLNVFLVGGVIDGDTTVDISALNLPLPISDFIIDYDGESYGAGFTLAAGGERWFASLTGVATDSNLGGNFDSSIEALTFQPRLGLNRGKWQYWVGGLYLDAEERHSGVVEIPFVGSVPFNVELSEQEQWNYSVGIRHAFGQNFEASLELGFGDRDHTLFYVGYRF